MSSPIRKVGVLLFFTQASPSHLYVRKSRLPDIPKAETTTKNFSR
jgi:hypothetical protein